MLLPVGLQSGKENLSVNEEANRSEILAWFSLLSLAQVFKSKQSRDMLPGRFASLLLWGLRDSVCMHDKGDEIAAV